MKTAVKQESSGEENLWQHIRGGSFGAKVSKQKFYYILIVALIKHM